MEHNTSKYRLEKCQFNIGSNGTHSVLDTPDLWANIVVYVTVEFPIDSCRGHKHMWQRVLGYKKAPVHSQAGWHSLCLRRVVHSQSHRSLNSQYKEYAVKFGKYA